MTTNTKAYAGGASTMTSLPLFMWLFGTKVGMPPEAAVAASAMAAGLITSLIVWIFPNKKC